MIELFFAYLAGLLTLINPCVLPILPIVLASAASSDRRGPLYLAAGMGISFVALGLFVATLGQTNGLDETRLGNIGAVLMIGFGLILVTPPLAARFETATAGLAAHADTGMSGLPTTGPAPPASGRCPAWCSLVSLHRTNPWWCHRTRVPRRKPLARDRHHGRFRLRRCYDHPRDCLRNKRCYWNLPRLFA